ncbi:MAG: hypothetical protein ACO20W_08850 [Anaerohalosphaeraceae bacterium]
MKRGLFIHFVVLFMLFNVGGVFAEEAKSADSESYTIKRDIGYREASVAEKDAYIGERCRLDVYYPSD